MAIKSFGCGKTHLKRRLFVNSVSVRFIFYFVTARNAFPPPQRYVLILFVLYFLENLFFCFKLGACFQINRIVAFCKNHIAKCLLNYFSLTTYHLPPFTYHLPLTTLIFCTPLVRWTSNWWIGKYSTPHKAYLPYKRFSVDLICLPSFACCPIRFFGRPRGEWG